jgi:hypothetical protein
VSGSRNAIPVGRHSFIIDRPECTDAVQYETPSTHDLVDGVSFAILLQRLQRNSLQRNERWV